MIIHKKIRESREPEVKTSTPDRPAGMAGTEVSEAGTELAESGRYRHHDQFLAGMLIAEADMAGNG